MTGFPHLSLADIVIDVELVRRLPRKLAYYHLALPLATDGKELSLAMAHPENSTVVEMLGSLLGAEIVPVHGSPSEIRAALDQIWQFVKKPAPHLLSWGSTLQRSSAALKMAETLGDIFAANVTDAQHNDLDTLLLLTQQDTYTLTVIGMSPSEDITNFIRQSATPALLLYGEDKPFGRIMLSLRGHSPDLSALDWVLPLATTYRAETTVLAVTASTPSDVQQRGRGSDSLAALLDPTREPAQHLAECTERLANAGISGYLKLCQGEPTQQIVTEFIQGNYALLVIISEAHGDFVQQIIEAVDMQSANHAILVVKPTPT